MSLGLRWPSPSVLFTVASGSSLEMNGTSGILNCSGDCDLNRQPRTPLQSSGVSRMADQKRSGTWLGASRLASHGRESNRL